MNARIGATNQSATFGGLRFTVVNSNNSRYGHTLTLVIRESGLWLYDVTANADVWVWAK